MDRTGPVPDRQDDLDPTAAGLTALVTGATSGIGRALAGSLAAAGATVGIVARDPVRGEQTRLAIVAATENERVELFVGDLADLGPCGTSQAQYPRLTRRSTSSSTAQPSTPRSGRSPTTASRRATNVLGAVPADEPPARPAPGGRSAWVFALSAPSTVRLDFDDLQSEQRFRSLTAFGATKAADLLFTFELAR